MGKGKGHQSGGFGSKSQRAVYRQEFQQEVGKVKLNRPNKSTTTLNSRKSSERPRFAPTLLKGLLRERQSEEAHERLQRRRREGFAPRRDDETTGVATTVEIISHPPGWILDYHGRVSKVVEQQPLISLQSKCLHVLGDYIVDYLEAMGREDLHAALSLLPSETLATLSVRISKNTGVTNDLAICLGQHAHVEALCFRAAGPSTSHEEEEDHATNTPLDDRGMLELVPRLPQTDDDYARDSWECLFEDDNHTLDVLQLEGCSLRLKRLELIDCSSLSATTLLMFLEKCSCITHLSLAGSLVPDRTVDQVLLSLPELLPALEVLDVTRCSWMSNALYSTFCQKLCTARDNGRAPLIVYEGCNSGAVIHLNDW